MRLPKPLVFAVFITGIAMSGTAFASGKPSSVKGKIYVGDKSHPFSDAVITLLDEKRSGEGVDTKTDESGNYEFADVPEGRYTISIRKFYDRQDDVPCQLLAGKIKDKNSSVLVINDRAKAKYVEQIFVRDFSIKNGKPLEKDIDVQCLSMAD